MSPRAQAWVRDSPYFSIAVGQLPCEVVAPVILEAFARHGRKTTAEMIGVEERTLFGILLQRSGVHYSVADAIVTRLTGAGWWLEGPQRRWYFGAESVFGRSSQQGWSASARPASVGGSGSR